MIKTDDSAVITKSLYNLNDNQNNQSVVINNINNNYLIYQISSTTKNRHLGYNKEVKFSANFKI